MNHVLLILCVLFLSGLYGCPQKTTDPQRPSQQDSKQPTPTPQQSSTPAFKIPKVTSGVAESKSLECTQFLDVHEQSGINFNYDRGATGKSLMVEATGGGLSWIDYDQDGRWDLYCVQGGNPIAKAQEQRPPNCLYRNQGDGQFLEVANFSGTGSRQYGQGVSAGDYDNDGLVDLYVTNVGRNELYHNMGDGTYELITNTNLTEPAVWSASAAWADLNRDGLLDLFVCNYLDYNPYDPVVCLDATGKPGTCHPNNISPVDNACYLNLGDGNFQEISKSAGLYGPGSKSLGVVVADFNADDWPDIYVTNDTTANFLFMNQQDGTFLEKALVLGCSRNGLGKFEASMGVAFGDYDQDGKPDLYCTHFTNESNTLYRNIGETGFVDTTARTRLQNPTLPYLGFGTVMADFNRNGHQELFVTNGHIDDWRDRGELLEMPPQLFQFNGSVWEDCSQHSGTFFQRNFLGRGVASCDYDDDGDLDLAVIHQGAPLALLRNETTSGHYLKVFFQGIRNNRDGLGAKVELKNGENVFVQQLASGTSYCASHEPSLLFGLNAPTSHCELKVTWPDGTIQHVNHVDIDQTITIVEADSPNH